MRRRKEGFSLVELLIVLAVMAALIATITPVALNAIRKARATKVAQDLQALASSFENYVYVNDAVPTTFSQLGRDIDESAYGLGYTLTDGTYQVTVGATGNVTLDAVNDVLANATSSASETVDDYGTNITSGIFYNFEFQVY
ncbi:MAG: type II secretion system protein [Kosmotoga sp.]|nr:MAG: type II secretion system protein [Kosmotoga sp.]